jgi:hypothetical protein
VGFESERIHSGRERRCGKFHIVMVIRVVSLEKNKFTGEHYFCIFTGSGLDKVELFFVGNLGCYLEGGGEAGSAVWFYMGYGGIKG